MQGDKKIIDELNKNLANEHTAIAQYITHANMCENWGLPKLAKSFKKRAIDEMKHSERLVERILFLQGIPDLSKLNTIDIGNDVEKMLSKDRYAELTAIKGYNEAIAVAIACKDNGSRKLFESILRDEEAHIDYIETSISQIDMVGLENYLVEQM